MKTVLFFFVFLLISGCGNWHLYDKDDPDDYYLYWCDPKNLKGSMAYKPKVGPDGQELEPFTSKEECIDSYYRAKDIEEKNQK